MGLESATFISDLVTTNPPGNDLRSQGDDHLRLLKAVLKATFPNASKAFYFPSSASKTADYTILATDMNTVIRVDTTAGVVQLTLPTLVVGDAGWEISLIKINTGVNPYYILPPSGTIQSGAISGLSKTRRCIPGSRTRVLWTGSAWIAERVLAAPVGSLTPFAGTVLPVGFEWPNGQTLSTTNYPDYASVRGSGSTPDIRGRIIAGKDNMGGSAAGRLTGTAGSVNGTTFEGTGGEERHTLVLSESPSHDHDGGGTTSGESNTHTHSYDDWTGPSQKPSSAGTSPPTNLATGQTGPNSTGHTHDYGFTTTPAGGDGPHNNVQPTIIENMILAVE